MNAETQRLIDYFRSSILSSCRHANTFNKNDETYKRNCEWLVRLYPHRNPNTVNDLAIKTRLHDLFCESGVVLLPVDIVNSIMRYKTFFPDGVEDVYDYIIRYKDGDYESDLLNFME